ncbi:MAG: response regulator [Lachnospiraceae bacterium]|nr:response regulator [Lachnospiraceae bacterium]
MMKGLKRAAWLVIAIQVFLAIYVVMQFRVDDMTLVKGEVSDFNTGWILYREDGSRTGIESLPYTDRSEAYETVALENTIPKEFAGLTMRFLTADKQFRVLVDGVEIYQFGMHDQRSFGHTPGSVVNFVDIPRELGDGKIRIEMMSPYQNYASYINAIEVGERDIEILRLIASILPKMACDMVIIFSGLILGAVGILCVVSKRDTGGLASLSSFCFVSFLYFSIETKVLSTMYGNQTLYSIMVFFCLMLLPILLQLYIEKSVEGIHKKISGALLALSVLNALLQIILQVLNVVDFMQLSVFSHALVFITTVCGVMMYMSRIRRGGFKDMESVLNAAAMIFICVGATVDVIRGQIIKVGDLGQYSRIGFMVFGIIMVYIHIMRISRMFAAEAGQAAVTIQQEKEKVEEQNRLLVIAREEAEAAKQEAQDANRAKSSFLANISHEIRTPINAVLGMDTMILRESHEDNIREYAYDIQNAGQNLLSLINDILDFSKIESGKMEIKPVDYELASLLGSCYNMIQMRAKDKELFFRMENSTSIPHLLHGDEVRVRQIIINLLTNAVKYTEKGEVVLSANWEKTDEENIRLIVAVSDTGMGIRYADQQKLFDDFRRLDMERNRNIEGTGLGLSITKQLIEMMNGKIYLESSYGKGSTFTVEIPQAVRSFEPIGDFQAHMQENAGFEEEYHSSFQAPEARLLVVDDVPMNLKVICELLKSTKMQIDTAESGKECLRRITQEKYHIIFLDHMMPDMDGIETLKNMKWVAENKNTDTPVIMLTANAIIGAKDEYFNAGFDDYLAKPVKENELEAVIQKYLPKELVVVLGDAKEADEEEYGGFDMRLLYKKPGASVNKPQAEQGLMHRLDFLDARAGASYFAGSEAIYREVLKSYALGKLRDEIVEYYEKEDWKNYGVKVHALKTTSLNIGAVELSEFAKALENALRNGDTDFVRSQHENILKEYDELLEKLREVLE